MMKKSNRVYAYYYVGLLVTVLTLVAAAGVVAWAADPVSVDVVLSDNVVAPDSTITVTAIARDANGMALSGFRFDIRIDANGTTTGNPPMMLDGQRIRFPKLPKRLVGHNPSLDPNGDFADTAPDDPNFGKQTGGIYTVTVTIVGTQISGSADVVVLPSSTAKVTVQTKQFGDQVNKLLGDLNRAVADGADIRPAVSSLRALTTDPRYQLNVLNMNSVIAPADGMPVTLDQLTAAGFQGSDDDGPFGTAVTSLQDQIRLAITRINQLNPASITQADIDAIQSILNRYQMLTEQIAGLQPSELAVTRQSDKLNLLIKSDVPKLFDTLNRKSIDIAARLSSSAEAGGLFGLPAALSVLQGYANQGYANHIELLTAFTSSAVNIIAAELINRNNPSSMTIEYVFASASVGAVCPDYPNTRLGGNNFSRDRTMMIVGLVGCPSPSLITQLRSLIDKIKQLALNLNPLPGGGPSWNLMNQLQNLVEQIRQIEAGVASMVATHVPDSVVRGLEGQAELELVFENGWRRVNQGRLPCAGLIVVYDFEHGTKRATNLNFLPSCGP